MDVVKRFNLTDKAGIVIKYLTNNEDVLYKEYKPLPRDIIPLPKPMLYLMMAAVVVVAVAYAIVGHLIKDLALDIADCLLGPAEQEPLKDGHLMPSGPSHLPPCMTNHNAFHVWDADDVIIPMTPPEGSPLGSPLLSVITQMPSFFPHTFSPVIGHSLPCHESEA
ncbi:hypothetical protein DPEC_G00172640 [Dallia pectoralis]|uniref:Uncharacterized protein n=1 Tax=Dallia pectoralis TaxID=75939 RepID=A0ACC2GDY6_DALPE|nr:hypothetical protein DPEC_G00172640 [Dallia pectoralis]